MTSGRRVRGYTFPASAIYLAEVVGKEQADSILEKTSPELRTILAAPKSVEWYPIALYSELNRTVADALGGGDEEKTHESLIECGKYAARIASNTFLRLLMRVLTPDLFAKKLPSLFARDFNFGHLEVKVDANGLVCEMTDMEGFDYGSTLSLGWAKFTLETMGKTITSARARGPSAANPGPPHQTFELSWKA